jgi:hypothetical protein
MWRDVPKKTGILNQERESAQLHQTRTRTESVGTHRVTPSLKQPVHRQVTREAPNYRQIRLITCRQVRSWLGSISLLRSSY